MNDRAIRIACSVSLCVVAFVALALPAPALAWGPLAHLSFSVQALGQLGSVPAQTHALLAQFPSEFLYGSLAADIIIGKNLARQVYHCHNWRVGFNVHRSARPGPEQAFALGFLAHLAADTVAHNYFVPYKSVASFQRMNTRHAYWELRYDQRMDRRLSIVARHVSGRAYRGHDQFLRRTLTGASVLPFSVSRGLFGGSVLASARNDRFQALSRTVLAPALKLDLEDELVEETGKLAVEAILGILRDGPDCAATRADARGAGALETGNRLRRAFARSHRKTPATVEREMTLEVRHCFRKAVQGPLVLSPALKRMAA